MNRFNDKLPEERIPEHEELITLLKHAYRAPVSLSSTEEEQVIERVRKRLLQMELEDSPSEEVPEAQTGVLNSTPIKSISPSRKLQRNRQRFRLVALLAAALVIAALLITPLLLKRFSLNSGTGGTERYPTLILSANAAASGSKVYVTLTHFSSSARVVLTHDIQEPIAINGISSITTNAQGSATFSLVIDTTWGSGFHLIMAEDVNSRSTASANLQITGMGPTHPAHLLIDTTPLDMGADFVGTNTIHSFTLANSGGGSISWSANSDAPWLLVAPSQGIFSQQEVISVAAQRLGLKPGDYHGRITISSNVSPPQHIEVNMTVRPLPPNAGPVLAVSPALLSFTANNGQQNTSSQTLTVSNPGSRPLNWSLAPVQGLTCNWLSETSISGTVPPGTSMTLVVNVQSQCLLPGVYTGTLKFTANGAIDSSQAVNVAVVVQPYCGLVTSTGFLAFTVVVGQNTLANQSLSLNETASCAGTPLSWKSSSTASWLSITPGSGQINANDTTLVSASVNARGLEASPKPYYANLSFVFGQSTLTVMAKVTVQAAPPPTAPIMSVSPLSLNFSNIQGQPDPTGQVVTITNNGHSPLSWHATAQPTSFFWLAASPLGGTIAPGQTGQVTIKVNTAQLVPGNYVGQITLNGMDTKGNPAPGGPQTVILNLVMQPPCTLSPPSSSALSFSAVQGASANPVAQSVMFTGTGSCVWPLSWKTSVTPRASWVTLTPRKGSTIQGTGQSGSVAVGANITGLTVGTYTTTVTIAAGDANGVAVLGSTQSFTVTLTVTGYTVSGSVVACPGSIPPTCTTPQPLPGATVTLVSGSTTVATTTADTSGNFAFSNVAPGTYTISVAGSDASNTHYVGSLAITLSGNAISLAVQAFPG